MKRLYERLGAAEAAIAATLLVLMTALIFLGGVLRMAGHPINWSLDFATAFFAWACFLCADVAWRRDSLMAVEVLTRRLPPAAQRALRLANYFLIAAFLVYLVVMGAWLAWTSRARSFQGIPEISYSWVTASAVAGGALLLVTTVLKIRDELRGRGRPTAADDLL
ncbi:MAG: TRAP transporter small permease subunit [Burkholderiales bacterium]|nr:TRAP transporter small permease subunit [Burkholderiales bacterium]